MPCKLPKEECNNTCPHKAWLPNCPNYIPESEPGSSQTDTLIEMNHVPVNATEENGMLKTDEAKDNLADNTGMVRAGNKPVHEGKRFSSEYQPDAQGRAAAAQKLKKRTFTRDSIRAIMNMKYAQTDDDVMKELKKHFGEEACRDLTMGDVMSMRQAIKAASTNDTAAYNAIVNQGMGMPVQAIAQTDTAGNDLPRINITPPAGFTMGLPSNTDGDGKREDNAATSETV